MGDTSRLETERLILRRFTPWDVEALLLIYSDEKTNRFLPWFPIRTKAEAERLLRERYLSAYERQEGYGYAVCLREDDRPVGYVHVSPGDSHDLGYGLRSDCWGRGIATEAAGAVLEQLRRDGVPFVTATHDVENPRSGAVMHRLGMRYCYSYGEQWQPKDLWVIFRMYQLNLDGRERVYMHYWDSASVRYVEPGL